jgi:hypothetical protein
MLQIGEEGFIGTTSSKGKITLAQAAKIEESLKEMNPDGEGKEKTVEELYLEGLEKVDMTLEKARVIQEAMFVNHYYEEEVRLAGTHYVVLRTRVYADSVRANRRLEADRVEYVASIQDIVNRYNTAASLVRYGDKVFNVPKPLDDVQDQVIEDSFTERLNFVTKLPSQVCVRLMQKVFEFDARVSAVFSDGAPLDF